MNSIFTENLKRKHTIILIRVYVIFMSEWFSWTNGTYPNFLDPTSIHCCPKAIVLKTTSFRWTATKIPMILTPFAFLSSGTAWPSVISTSWSPSSWGRGSCGKTASRTSGWLASSWGFGRHLCIHLLIQRFRNVWVFILTQSFIFTGILFQFQWWTRNLCWRGRYDNFLLSNQQPFPETKSWGAN